MRDLPEKVVLIIPCYNEAARLETRHFLPVPAGLTLIFVDDGSTDGTRARLAVLSDPSIQVVTLEKNVGKAEAIRAGMHDARTRAATDQAQWIGYWDADFSTGLGQIAHFIDYARLHGRPVDAIWGSRIYKYGSRIRRSFRRHVLGRLFATLAGFLFPELGFYDSQCGAKLFRPSVIGEAFDAPFLSHWLFDVEIALRLRGRMILECPLEQWDDISGSKVSIWRDAGNVALDLWRLRRAHPRSLTPTEKKR